MIKIKVPSYEIFENGQFTLYSGGELTFEYSLKAIRLWESKYRTPFLGQKHTPEEMMFFAKCMLINDELEDLVEYMDVDNITNLFTHIREEYTATKTYFKKTNNVSKIKVLTAEVYYAMMCIRGVPIECENWNLYSLIQLMSCIAVLTSNDDVTDVDTDELKDRYAENLRRREMYKSKG